MRIELTCCLCRRRIGQQADVYHLDTEWQRRCPGMRGALACERCATLRNSWSCLEAGGGYVDGHIPSEHQPPDADFDSWSHLSSPGTPKAMAWLYPAAAIAQGATEYLARRLQLGLRDRAMAQNIRVALEAAGYAAEAADAEWNAEHRRIARRRQPSWADDN